MALQTESAAPRRRVIRAGGRDLRCGFGLEPRLRWRLTGRFSIVRSGAAQQIGPLSADFAEFLRRSAASNGAARPI
ncbi:MAG TPA: hypothetical protein VGC77_16205 [Rhodopseudomonas sp.]|uniref:hypothetical protein n=1 Tax=Rhodopseudomonas sp. TaxID=1078 RepID=UPI002ED9C82E